MFKHIHPYPPFIPEGTERLIVGTLPPPRFSTGLLKIDDVDFCYGSRDGLLWKILNHIFNLNLEYAQTEKAIEQRKAFLMARKIGVCDIVASCERQKVDASDLGMMNVELRDLLHYLTIHPTVHTLVFTGGNSKNGPEYFFRQLIKAQKIKLEVVQTEVPRIYSFDWAGRIIRTVSLTAPSGAANRAIGSMDLYKSRKSENPKYNTFDFRVEQYTPHF